MNLSDAAQKLCAVAEKAASVSGADASSVVDAVVAKCEAMLEEDIYANRVAASTSTYFQHSRPSDRQNMSPAGHRQAWRGGFAESATGQKSDKRQAPDFDPL